MGKVTLMQHVGLHCATCTWVMKDLTHGLNDGLLDELWFRSWDCSWDGLGIMGGQQEGRTSV